MHTLRSLLWVVLLALPASARAAKPVVPDSRPVRVEHYDAAAKQLGLAGWGAALDNEQCIHVMLRLDSDRATLGVGVPAAVTRARAEAWFRKLADAAQGAPGWGGADLYLASHEGRFFLRAVRRGGQRWAGLGSSEAVIDLPLLRARLAELHPEPAWLAVRLVGADLSWVTPAPVASIRIDDDSYVFYRLDSGARLARIGYGLPRRWVVAAVGSLLMWALLPLLLLWAAREQARRQVRLDAPARLDAYRRWEKGVRYLIPAGLIATVFLLGFGRFRLLFGGSMPFVMLLFLPMYAVSTVARLVGLPLERAAFPERAAVPWYRMIGGEIAGLVLICAMFGVVPVVMAGRAGALVPGIGLLFALPLLAVAAILAWSTLAWRRRLRGEAPGETAAAGEVMEQVREITTRVGCRVERILVPERSRGATHVEVREGVAVVPAALMEALQPDQVAAIVALQALLARQTPGERALHWATALAGLAPLLVLVPAGIRGGGGARSAFAMMAPVLLLSMPLMLVLATVSSRRRQQRHDEADRLIGDLLPEPRRYVEALEAMHRLQLAGLTSSTSAAVLRVHQQRMERLRRRLGVD